MLLCRCINAAVQVYNRTVTRAEALCTKYSSSPTSTKFEAISSLDQLASLERLHVPLSGPPLLPLSFLGYLPPSCLLWQLLSIVGYFVLSASASAVL